MSRGLGAEQRIILAIIVRDTGPYWTRADIKQLALIEIGRGADAQSSPEHLSDKNVREWLADMQLSEGGFTRSLGSLVKRGLLERHQLPSSPLTWRVTQAGIDAASEFVPPSAINDLAKGAA